MFETAPKPRFKESAAVIFVRGAGESLETYWVKRSDRVSYMPGFEAFLGGKVNPEDVELEVAGAPEGAERVMRACALREAFEEAGVLLATAGRAARRGAPPPARGRGHVPGSGARARLDVRRRVARVRRPLADAGVRVAALRDHVLRRARAGGAGGQRARRRTGEQRVGAPARRDRPMAERRAHVRGADSVLADHARRGGERG